MYSKFRSLMLLVCGFGLIAACEEEQPVRSVSEFLEDPVMLEAAIVRCSMDRDQTRYDAECINARQAVRQIEAKEEAARRADFDARSESKRQALRRTQEAAARARSRAAAAEKMRREAEYLAQFGVAPPTDVAQSQDNAVSGNSPLAVIPDATEPAVNPTGNTDAPAAVDGGNAPLADRSQPNAADLGSIRDELQRRNEEDGD